MEGIGFGVAGYVFSDAVFEFYLCDTATLALLENPALVVAFILSFVLGLTTSVPVGMVVAAQQFRFLAGLYGSGVVVVYIPILLYATIAGERTITLSWLYIASTAYCAWKLVGASYCAAVMIPRVLETEAKRQRDGRTGADGATGAWQYNRPRAQQYVGKSQSCMVISGRFIVHAPVQTRSTKGEKPRHRWRR